MQGMLVAERLGTVRLLLTCINIVLPDDTKLMLMLMQTCMIARLRLADIGNITSLAWLVHNEKLSASYCLFVLAVHTRA